MEDINGKKLKYNDLVFYDGEKLFGEGEYRVSKTGQKLVDWLDDEYDVTEEIREKLIFVDTFDDRNKNAMEEEVKYFDLLRLKNSSK